MTNNREGEKRADSGRGGGGGGGWGGGAKGGGGGAGGGEAGAEGGGGGARGGDGSGGGWLSRGGRGESSQSTYGDSKGKTPEILLNSVRAKTMYFNLVDSNEDVGFSPKKELSSNEPDRGKEGLGAGGGSS